MQMFINVGILLSYVSNYAFSGLPVHLGWRVMFGVGVIPPVFIAAGVLFIMPESLRWLVISPSSCARRTPRPRPTSVSGR
jgi:MFS family permease